MNSLCRAHLQPQPFGPDKRPPLMMHGGATRRNDTATRPVAILTGFPCFPALLPTNGKAQACLTRPDHDKSPHGRTGAILRNFPCSSTRRAQSSPHDACGLNRSLFLHPCIGLCTAHGGGCAAFLALGKPCKTLQRSPSPRPPCAPTRPAPVFTCLERCALLSERSVWNERRAFSHLRH